MAEKTHELTQKRLNLSRWLLEQYAARERNSEAVENSEIYPGRDTARPFVRPVSGMFTIYVEEESGDGN